MKQHYVQEAYLKEFTEDRAGHFHQLHIRSKQISKRHTGQVCFMTDYFDVNDPKIQQRFNITGNPRYLEGKGFAQFENVLIDKFSAIKAKNPATSKADIQYIIEWYLISKLRNPFYVNAVNGIWDKLYDEAIKRELIDTGEYKTLESLGINYKEFAEELKGKQLSDPEHGKKFHLTELLNTSFQDNLPVKETLEKMLTMNVVILEAGEPDHFIVTDNPGFTLKKAADGIGRIVYNADFLNFDEVFIPINSKQAILFEGTDPLSRLWEMKHLRYESLPASEIQKYNQASTMFITSKVFCQDREYLKSLADTLK